ncbi:hypothetical protein EIN_327640 [Entamoeba invadens IP1]|uniref:Nucleolar pre-ribosomal-associated protein 1 C-terminal domain-containing protein n=1 Tax=Entamoeba invadens IP1 TaxID=370355 RepID=A0A0A1TXJ8_ENTIV|nr:hypothetical protein EIN_327640 [Entamoeba invadens IP1]ELP86107.1 hypothetical protein EIN_327640 [Entamoeba invadens IP1]|eukprot:XP_004185453.1 hypothetical protein EIN_327640 [Entamoeba invadens IP1]
MGLNEKETKILQNVTSSDNKVSGYNAFHSYIMTYLEDKKENNLIMYYLSHSPQCKEVLDVIDTSLKHKEELIAAARLMTLLLKVNTFEETKDSITKSVNYLLTDKFEGFQKCLTANAKAYGVKQYFTELLVEVLKSSEANFVLAWKKLDFGLGYSVRFINDFDNKNRPQSLRLIQTLCESFENKNLQAATTNFLQNPNLVVAYLNDLELDDAETQRLFVTILMKVAKSEKVKRLQKAYFFKTPILVKMYEMFYENEYGITEYKDLLYYLCVDPSIITPEVQTSTLSAYQSIIGLLDAFVMKDPRSRALMIDILKRQQPEVSQVVIKRRKFGEIDFLMNYSDFVTTGFYLTLAKELPVPTEKLTLVTFDMIAKSLILIQKPFLVKLLYSKNRIFMAQAIFIILAMALRMATYKKMTSADQKLIDRIAEDLPDVQILLLVSKTSKILQAKVLETFEILGTVSPNYLFKQDNVFFQTVVIDGLNGTDQLVFYRSLCLTRVLPEEQVLWFGKTKLMTHPKPFLIEVVKKKMLAIESACKEGALESKQVTFFESTFNEIVKSFVFKDSPLESFLYRLDLNESEIQKMVEVSKKIVRPVQLGNREVFKLFSNISAMVSRGLVFHFALEGNTFDTLNFGDCVAISKYCKCLKQKKDFEEMFEKFVVENIEKCFGLFDFKALKIAKEQKAKLLESAEKDTTKNVSKNKKRDIYKQKQKQKTQESVETRPSENVFTRCHFLISALTFTSNNSFSENIKQLIQKISKTETTSDTDLIASICYYVTKCVSTFHNEGSSVYNEIVKNLILHMVFVIEYLESKLNTELYYHMVFSLFGLIGNFYEKSHVENINAKVLVNCISPFLERFANYPVYFIEAIKLYLLVSESVNQLNCGFINTLSKKDDKTVNRVFNMKNIESYILKVYPIVTSADLFVLLIKNLPHTSQLLSRLLKDIGFNKKMIEMMAETEDLSGLFKWYWRGHWGDEKMGLLRLIYTLYCSQKDFVSKLVLYPYPVKVDETTPCGFENFCRETLIPVNFMIFKVAETPMSFNFLLTKIDGEINDTKICTYLNVLLLEACDTQDSLLIEKAIQQIKCYDTHLDVILNEELLEKVSKFIGTISDDSFDFLAKFSTVAIESGAQLFSLCHTKLHEFVVKLSQRNCAIVKKYAESYFTSFTEFVTRSPTKVNTISNAIEFCKILYKKFGKDVVRQNEFAGMIADTLTGVELGYTICELFSEIIDIENVRETVLKLLSTQQTLNYKWKGRITEQFAVLLGKVLLRERSSMATNVSSNDTSEIVKSKVVTVQLMKMVYNQYTKTLSLTDKILFLIIRKFANEFPKMPFVASSTPFDYSYTINNFFSEPAFFKTELFNSSLSNFPFNRRYDETFEELFDTQNTTTRCVEIDQNGSENTTESNTENKMEMVNTKIQPKKLEFTKTVDPAYLLPLLYRLVNLYINNTKLKFNGRAFATNGFLSYVIACTSLTDEKLRKVSYCVLQRSIYLLNTQTTFQQFHLFNFCSIFLQMLRNTTDVENKRYAPLSSMYFARMSKALFSRVTPFWLSLAKEVMMTNLGQLYMFPFQMMRTAEGKPIQMLLLVLECIEDSASEHYNMQAVIKKNKVYETVFSILSNAFTKMSDCVLLIKQLEKVISKVGGAYCGLFYLLETLEGNYCKYLASGILRIFLLIVQQKELMEYRDDYCSIVLKIVNKLLSIINKDDEMRTVEIVAKTQKVFDVLEMKEDHVGKFFELCNEEELNAFFNRRIQFARITNEKTKWF